MATLQEVKDRFPFQESYVQRMIESSKQDISLDDMPLFRNGPTVLSKACADRYMYPSLVAGYFLEHSAGVDYFLSKSAKELFPCLEGKLLESQRIYLCTSYEDLPDSKVSKSDSHDLKDVFANISELLENYETNAQIHVTQKEVETKEVLGSYFDTLSKVVLHFEQGEQDQVHLYAKQLMKEVLVDQGVKPSWLDNYHTPLTVYATLLKLLDNSAEQAIGFITASQEMGRKYELSNSGFLSLANQFNDEGKEVLKYREPGTVGLDEVRRRKLLEVDCNLRFMRMIVEQNVDKLVADEVLELKRNYNHVVQEAKPTLDHYFFSKRAIPKIAINLVKNRVDDTPKPPHNFELMPLQLVSADKVDWWKWE